MNHYRLSLAILGPGLLALGMLFLTSQAGLSQPATKEVVQFDRDKQIAELEKQIADMQAKLKNLKDKEQLPSAKTQSDYYPLPESWAKSMNWRNIGPANMGGRITSLSVFEPDPTIYWVATASGGLLKTTNNGSTFKHQFDKEATVSIGAVAVAPFNKNIVWVGTGEANPRNSVSYGDGVYKSTDGGDTWKNMGLNKTYQIGDIVVHPVNPDIVYVAALGRLYGPNEERGLYKTTDGGKTWDRVLYVDDKTGALDIAMHPKDPETLLVATWERQRDEYDSFKGDSKAPPGTDGYAPIKVHAPGSGVWKTTDGGKSFKRLTKGLPTSKMGRIGLDYYRKDPNTIFAIIDTENAGKGQPPSNTYLGVQNTVSSEGLPITAVTEGSPAEKGGLKKDDVIISIDGKAMKNDDDFGAILQAKKPNDKVKIGILRDKTKMELEVTLGTRPQGGGGFGGQGQRGGGGQRAGGGGQGQGQGQRQRPGIGATLEEVEGGMKITEIVAKSPAEKAGLKVEDVIVSFDDTEIENQRVLFKLLFAKNVGDKAKIVYLRGKDKKEVELTLEVVEGAVGGLGGGGVAGRPYGGGQLGGQRENVQSQQGPEGWDTGGVYKSTDNGESWTRINSFNPRPFYFSVVKVDPSDDNILWVNGVNLKVSSDGGRTFLSEFITKGPDGKEVRFNITRGVHDDGHAMWINPKDGRHILIGTDGGFYVTYDRGGNWEHMNHFALGQFYHVAVDNRRPYRVYGGLQDNGTWGGPSASFRISGPINEDYIFVNGGDGFVCRVDQSNPDLVYGESQDGNMMRRDMKTGETKGIRPRGVAGVGTYRWNWNTPFILSNHNPQIFYCAANYVFRSVKHGDDLKIISPEITRTKRGTGTAVAESPKNQDVLWAGTDDGAVWVTRNGGKDWTNVSDKILKAGLPGPRWVSSIEASNYEPGRAYVVFDAHRSNDDEPYLFVTENYGETWKSIRANLPTGSSRVLREDIVNQNLLYVGTEFAAYVSLDRGKSWGKLNGNTLPTVAVHEFAQPTVADELVAATHGRSLWILDVKSLRQMSTDIVKGKTTLFSPATVTRWNIDFGREGMFNTGTRKFVGTNPPRGATIDFVLEKKPSKISLKVQDIKGATVRELEVKKEAGFQRVIWDLRRSGGFGQGGFPTGGLGGAAFRGLDVSPAQYRVVLNIDGQEMVQGLSVEGDPRTPTSGVVSDEVEEERALKKILKKEAAEDDSDRDR